MFLSDSSGRSSKSNEIAENEQESWSKLIRVLTHEIMNTVTPIASLSETLLKFDNVD